MNVPCGMSAGLPVGMQLVARALQRVDDLPRRARLRAARRLAQLLSAAARGMAANPFRSDWLDGGRAERLRPQGTLSYVSGATDEPLRFITICRSSSTKTVARHGARDAAIFDAEKLRLSWYDLKRRADELAAGLLALGLRRGNRVGIWAPNRHEWIVTQFATARVGLILVNINPAYRKAELEYALNKVGCRALVHGAPLQEQRLPRHARRDRARDPFQGRERGARQRAPAAAQARRAARRRAGAAALPVVGAGARARRPGAARAARRACAPRSTPTTRSTSSSPAAPPARRRARRCRTSTSSTTRATAPRRWRSAREDRLCIPVPLYHCFGMVLGVLCAAASGATMVFPGEGFDAGETLALDRAASLHRAARRADDVRRDARGCRPSRSTTCRRCAPASWPARRARSRPCAR